MYVTQNNILQHKTDRHVMITYDCTRYINTKHEWSACTELIIMSRRTLHKVASYNCPPWAHCTLLIFTSLWYRESLFDRLYNCLLESLLGESIRQPAEAFIQTFTTGGTRTLDIYMCRVQRNVLKFIRELVTYNDCMVKYYTGYSFI